LAPADGRRPALPPGGSESADGPLAGFEAAMLALRTADGLTGSSLDATTRAGIEQQLAEPLAAGLLDRTPDGGLVLTLRGRLLSNEVFGRLLPTAG